MDTGEPRLAVATLKRLVQMQPENVRAWINLAVAHFARDRHGEGIDASRRALSLDPSNVLAVFNLALAHERLKRYDEAMEWTRMGIDLDPRDQTLQKMELRLRVLKFRSRLIQALKWCVGRR
jgi:tetratricopeptide (TPR) repeat protein